MFHYGTLCFTLNRFSVNISKHYALFTQFPVLWKVAACKRYSFLPKKTEFLVAEICSKEPSSYFFSFQGASSKRKEYLGKKVVGFTMDQMFEVVSDVENYNKFVPFCKKSYVHCRNEEELFGELEIGFPPVIESYTSRVVLKKPHLVKAVCKDGRLFDHLVTIWKFSPGLKEYQQSCVIDFYVSFEFKSLLHSKLADIFFSELVRQMESAFFREAQKRYGNPTINVIQLKTS